VADLDAAVSLAAAWAVEPARADRVQRSLAFAAAHRGATACIAERLLMHLPG
jgi:hypothetical protein